MQSIEGLFCGKKLYFNKVVSTLKKFGGKENVSISFVKETYDGEVVYPLDEPFTAVLLKNSAPEVMVLSRIKEGEYRVSNEYGVPMRMLVRVENKDPRESKRPRRKRVL